jgi:hypothetical protein
VEITMLANDTRNPPATMNAHERLTWEEICRRYPDEWVVMAEIEWVNDTDFEFRTALVLAHHKTRKEASPSVKAGFQHYTEVGSFFTGRLIPPAYERLVP